MPIMLLNEGMNVYDIRKKCEGPLCYDFSRMVSSCVFGVGQEEKDTPSRRLGCRKPCPSPRHHSLVGPPLCLRSALQLGADAPSAAG
jgi:hypothetical protein